MIFYEQPTEPWKPFDFKLLEAYQMLQDEICQTCGSPIWICHSTDGNVNVVVRKTTCYGKAELDKKDKQREKSPDNKSLKLAPGEQEYVVFEPIDEVLGMPTRQQYYESLAH